MKGRDKLIFNLLSFLLLVVIVLVGLKTRDADKQIKRWEADIKRRQERGVEDPVLRETVDKLESDLQARLLETFELEPDPLDLTRVIKTRKFLSKFEGKFAELEDRMRLSCTVTSERGPSALIAWKGRNFVVVAGDMVGDYRVTNIGTNSATLKRGVEVLTLMTEKAPDTKAAEELLTAGRQPKIEVKQVSAENF